MLFIPSERKNDVPHQIEREMGGGREEMFHFFYFSFKSKPNGAINKTVGGVVWPVEPNRSRADA